MRVLHIIHNLDRSGAQRSLSSLVSGFEDIGGEHLIASWKRLGDVAAEISVPIVGNWGKPLPAIQHLRRLASDFRPDIIHAHMDDSAIFAAITAAPRDIPFFVTFHNGTRLVPDLPQPMKALRLAALRASAKRSAGIIGVRAALAPLLIKHLRIDPARVHTLPACVVVPTEGKTEHSDARSREPIRVVSIGRHVPLKRHEELISAAKVLAERGIAANVRILGDGPLLEENRTLAAAVPAPVTVNLPGSVSDVEAELLAADVLVNSSEYEGTSMAILEAMSYGVPVVASNVEGNRELVRRDQTGFPYTSGNADDLANQILAAASQGTGPITRSARMMVQEKFSATALADLHINLYNEALSR